MANRRGKSENSDRFYFLRLLNHADCSREIKRCLLLGRKAVTNLNSIIKSRDITLPTKICIVKPMVFAVVICGCESWTIKKVEHQIMDAFEIVVLEKTLESPLDSKETQPVHLKGNQSWIFIGRIDGEADAPIIWLPDVKSWLIGKDPDAGKDWRLEEKGATEDDIIDSMDLSLRKLWETVKDREAWCAASMGSQRVEQDWATELNWTYTTLHTLHYCSVER